MVSSRILLGGALLCLVAESTTAFTIPRPGPLSFTKPRHNVAAPLFMSTSQEEGTSASPPEPATPEAGTVAPESSTRWNPELRRIMGSVAILGALETAILTYSKLSGPSALDLMCGTSGDCTSVLNGPYAVLPFTQVPLAALGCAAYLLTFVVAEMPVLNVKENDTNNRIALLALTTAMATFSIFLMSLIYGVLHSSCLYCLASACFSVTLAACAWLGGCVPEQPQKAKMGIQAGVGSVLATTVAAVAIFVTVDPTASSFPGNPPSSSTLLVSSSNSQVFSPPSITTTSSDRALALSQELRSLDARMFGAYWCSHCYDQKQTFGKQAFSSLQYVECAKDGENSQLKLCKEKDVPGYPTWEISGTLYPGERDLGELEDIVKDIKKK